MKNKKFTLQDLEYGEETEKTWKMRHKHCFTCKMEKNTKKRGELEIHTVEPGVWRENRKSRKMRNSQCRTWNKARNSEKTEK